MRTIYIAFDDTEFDNEKACLEYEAILREREVMMLADMHAFDSKGKKLEDIQEILDRANYIHFSSERSFNMFNKVSIEEGYDPVDKYCKFAADDVYVCDGDEWVSTIEQMGECLSILERFGGKQC